MTPLERYIARCRTPYDEERNNCAHAALYALQGYEKAEVAFNHAMSADVRHKPLLERARVAAISAGLPVADSNGLGFGVAETPAGHAIALRAHGAWWTRGKFGAVRIKPQRVLAGWSVE